MGWMGYHYNITTNLAAPTEAQRLLLKVTWELTITPSLPSIIIILAENKAII